MIIQYKFTYVLEVIATFIQKLIVCMSIRNKHGVTYGDLYLNNEREFSKFNFEYGWVVIKKKIIVIFYLSFKNAYKKYNTV